MQSIWSDRFADGTLWKVADEWEAASWKAWEDEWRSGHSGSASSYVEEVPVLHLPICNSKGGETCSGSGSIRPSLRDVQEVLGSDFLSRPLLLRGLWTAEQLSNPDRHLSLSGMTTHSNLANLPVPYYADATKSGYVALAPSGLAPLGEIVRNITLGGKQKIGSQVIA